MLYTIGRTSSYEQYFREQGIPRKLGRNDPQSIHEGYEGGSVWQTKEDAQKHCPDDYSIYGVLADWETQTTPNKTEPWNDLLETSILVKLDNQ